MQWSINVAQLGEGCQFLFGSLQHRLQSAGGKGGLPDGVYVSLVQWARREIAQAAVSEIQDQDRLRGKPLPQLSLQDGIGLKGNGADQSVAELP